MESLERLRFRFEQFGASAARRVRRPKERARSHSALRSHSVDKLICPPGRRFPKPRQAVAKNVLLFRMRNRLYGLLVPIRGVRRHERGAECGGHATHSRTAKSCGPGAPMQASSPRGRLAPRERDLMDTTSLKAEAGCFHIVVLANARTPTCGIDPWYSVAIAFAKQHLGSYVLAFAKTTVARQTRNAS
jgi:hypothetical protein